MITSAEPVCLLDDDPAVLRALGRLFASVGLRTEQFSEPARFLEYAQRRSVKLALIDVRMPGMSGLEVLARLREMSPDTRVVIMTGDTRSPHQAAAIAGGASAFLLKPIDEQALFEAVRAADAARFEGHYVQE